jgi:hypothetical protein
VPKPQNTRQYRAHARNATFGDGGLQPFQGERGNTKGLELMVIILVEKSEVPYEVAPKLHTVKHAREASTHRLQRFKDLEHGLLSKPAAEFRVAFSKRLGLDQLIHGGEMLGRNVFCSECS